MDQVGPAADGWALCSGGGDIPFLPDDCLLCPKHADMFDQIACDPSLLERDDEDEAKPAPRP